MLFSSFKARDGATSSNGSQSIILHILRRLSFVFMLCGTVYSNFNTSSTPVKLRGTNSAKQLHI